MAEDRAVEERTGGLLTDWEHSKPIEGALRPDDALGQLQIFESKFARLKEERDNVAKAKEALELQYSSGLFYFLSFSYYDSIFVLFGF